MSTGYRAARETAAVVDLGPRTLLAVSGPPRQRFLHRILSNDVESLRPGQGVRACLMDVKGHLLALLRVLIEAETVVLEAMPQRREVLLERLAFYKLATPVRFQSGETAALGVLGPGAAELLGRLGLAAPGALEAHAGGRLQGTDVRMVRAGELPCSGFLLHVPTEAVDAVRAALQAAGAALVSADEFAALRIEQGRPFEGADITEDNLLHETGVLAEYHSSTKGCYVGQEVVARLEARGGNVNKRLLGLRLATPVASGTPLTLAGEAAGRVTTAAVSPRLGPLALGYVARRHAEPGTALLADGVEARVSLLPIAEEA